MDMYPLVLLWRYPLLPSSQPGNKVPLCPLHHKSPLETHGSGLWLPSFYPRSQHGNRAASPGRSCPAQAPDNKDEERWEQDILLQGTPAGGQGIKTLRGQLGVGREAEKSLVWTDRCLKGKKKKRPVIIHPLHSVYPPASKSQIFLLIMAVTSCLPTAKGLVEGLPKM